MLYRVCWLGYTGVYCVFQGVGPARGCQAKESDTVNYTECKIYRKRGKPCFQQLRDMQSQLIIKCDFGLRVRANSTHNVVVVKMNKLSTGITTDGNICLKAH